MSDGVKRRRWTAHPWRARGVRLLVYALPIAVSLGFVYLATSLVTAPTSSLWAFLLWWLATSLAATLVVSAVYAISRRLLPLGALLELSLVFPDATPSRVRLALRTGSVETLEQRLELIHARCERERRRPSHGHAARRPGARRTEASTPVRPRASR